MILTNPDMLHTTLLPDFMAWAAFLRGLRFVVLDEAHTYAGAFGAHVGMVLRRLVRVCAQLGARPQFICCSATIANPAAHARKLIPFAALGLHQDVVVVDQDTSPLGSRTLAIWNPPLKQACQQRQQQQQQSPDHCAMGCAPGSGDPGFPIAVASAASTSPAAVGSGAVAGSEDATGAAAAATTTTTAAVTGVPEETIGPHIAAFLRGCEDRPEIIVEAEGHVRRGGRLRWQDRMRHLGERVDPEGQTGRSAGGAVLTSPRRRSALDVLAAELAVQGPHRSETETLNGTAALVCGVSGEAVPPNANADADADADADANADLAPVAPGPIDPTRERTSSIVQTALVFVALVKKGLRTLAFCKYRKLCEMVLRYALQDLHTSAPALVHSVASYRGGYEKEERRTIEAGLFGGQLVGVPAGLSHTVHPS